MAQNEGKRFEKNFTDSLDETHIWHKRLNDNASSWAGGQNTRFATNNECDFLIHDDDTSILCGFELKSTEGSSLTFWREDFEKKDKKQTFMIKKNQILGLLKWSKHRGVFGFIINFRDSENHTYFVDINNFVNYTSAISKKSINRSDVLQMDPIEIKSVKLKTNYRYDINGLLLELGRQGLENKNG